ncbi:MAG TPA: SH3 domain-containing protein [Polyangia bacterium]|nr:SH3 domain-containing protein [Polyangia bacterium]
MRFALACLVVATGCTAVQYDGPRLPRSRVARIGGNRAHVKVIDGHPVAAPYVEVLPGEHQIEVAMAAPLPFGAAMVSTHDLTVCFAAYPGRFYEVKPAASIPYVHNHWRPAVFDQQAEVFVEHPCPGQNPVGVPGPLAPPAADQIVATVSTTADLRTAPSSAAPVLIHLNAGAQLVVSKQVQDGWRVTSYRNRRVAYVRDAGLLIAAPAPPATPR